VMSKETALPFALVLGALALYTPSTTNRSRREYGAALALGAIGGVLTIAALNLFRYGVPWNRYYVRSGWAVPSYLRRGEYFAGQLVAPNAGLLWFWPVASVLLAVASVQAARALRAGAAIRSRAGVVGAAALLLAVLLATLASWWSPFGWFAFGSRLIVPWVPALLALLAAAWGPQLRDAFTWLAGSLPRLIAASALVLVFGLAQLGALLHPLRPLHLFSPESCRPIPNLLERIPAGDGAAHAANDACLSRRAWTEKSVLVDTLGGLTEGDIPLALLYCAAMIGLTAGSAMSLRRPDAVALNAS
jgi:hypothetical protein